MTRSGRTPLILVILLGLVGVAHVPRQARAGGDNAAIQKTLKRLVGAIRYGKNDLAAKQIAFDGMSQRLLGKAWGKMSAAQRKELAAGVETLVRKVSFPKGRALFEHLDNVLYASAKVKGNEARCKSTVVVHRNYKKTELVITWVLAKGAQGWQVVDTIMMGESTTTGIHEDEVEPLLAQGGVTAVLGALKKKLAEIDNK